MKRYFPLTNGGLFRRRVGTVRAVDGVSFDIREGETLGLVGESGCGKTTTLIEIMRPRCRRTKDGSSILGRDVATLATAGAVGVRRDLQIVFQDPLASLDPRLPIVRHPRRAARGTAWVADRVNRAHRRAAEPRRPPTPTT